jgi:hypothetical protein
MSSSSVWVQLYIGNDKSGRVFDIDHAPEYIGALTRAVHQARGKSLGHCDAADPLVYAPGTEQPDTACTRS